MISVVIPTKGRDSLGQTIRSLERQTMRPSEVIVVKDQHKQGAAHCRNVGVERSSGDLILFSDDDIDWQPRAIEALHRGLEENPKASYAYGWFTKPSAKLVFCRLPFDANRLRRANYISTMSLVRREDFPGFDPSLKRLQDWDLWLTMLEQGKVGQFVDYEIFRTEDSPDGISVGSAHRAALIVRRKHGLA